MPFLGDMLVPWRVTIIVVSLIKALLGWPARTSHDNIWDLWSIPFSTHLMDIRWSPVHLMAYGCFAPESDLEFRIKSVIEIVGYDKHGWTTLPLNSSSGFPRCNKNQPTNFLGHRLESLPPPTFLKSGYSSNKNPRKDSDLMTFMTHEIPDIYHKNQRNGGKHQRHIGRYTVHGSYYVWFCLVGCRWILTKNGWQVDMFEENKHCQFTLWPLLTLDQKIVERYTRWWF